MKTGCKKRIIAMAAVMAMAIGMAGCGDKKYESGISKEGGYTQEEASTTKAMVVGDYDIYLDELIMYSMQAIYMQGLASDGWTDENESSNKEIVLSLLRENKIIYDIAMHNDVELNDSDMEYVQTSISSFKNRFGQDIFDKYGISDELIERVYREQACVAKFENDIKNSMGQEIQDDVTELYQDSKFHTVYYMLFPTVEIDENDEPVQDDDGNYVYVDDTDKEAVKAQAEEAVEKLRAGASYEEIAEEYGVSAYSSERSGMAGAYDDEMNELMDSLQDGDCAEPFEDTLGYVVLVMINADDTGLKDSFIQTYTSETLSDEYDNLRTMWLATIPVDTENDMEGTVWQDFDLKALIVDMETGGILKTN